MDEEELIPVTIMLKRGSVRAIAETEPSALVWGEVINAATDACKAERASNVFFDEPSTKGVVLTKLESLYTSCPEQWEGWDVDGKYYYIRYRYGYLSVTNNESYNSIDYFGKQIGDEMDGCMSTEDMLEHTGFVYL